MPEKSQREQEPSPFDKMRALVQQVVNVPKTEIDQREKEWRESRQATSPTPAAK